MNGQNSCWKRRREARRKGEDIGKTAEQEEAESQAAYKHGVSMWNFNLDELKAEAAAIDTAAAAAGSGGDGNVGGPTSKGSIQKKGSRFKIIEEEKSGALSDSGASTQSAAKIEQKGRFTISDDLPTQPSTTSQQEQQQQQPQRKLRKKVDSSSKKKKAASKLRHRKEAPKSSRCARKWSSSRGRKRKPFVLSARRTRVYEGRWRSSAGRRESVEKRKERYEKKREREKTRRGGENGAYVCASPPVRLCVRFYSHYYVVSVFIVHYICDGAPASGSNKNIN